MTAERLLVIILAVALAVLLVLSIIAIVRVLQLVSQLKKATEHIERITEKALSLSDILKIIAAPLTAIKLFFKIARTADKKKQKRNR